MKKLLTALLACALVFALVPAAFADNAEDTVSDMSGLTAAIAAAEPGDVITLEPGTYAPRGGVLKIDKPVSLSGAASGVEIDGAIVYDLAGEIRGSKVTLSRLSINAVSGQDCGVALVSGRGWVLALENCDLNGWKYGAAVYPECRSCKLDIYGGKFDCFAAVSVAAVSGNGVQRLVPGSTGLYEYCEYASGSSKFYYAYDESGRSAPDFASDSAVTALWPASARLGSAFYATLGEALRAARDGDTVYALLGRESQAGTAVTVRPGVTLSVRTGAYIFEHVENNGAVRNGGVIRGGVSGEGETLTLVRAEPEPASLSVRVTDKSGRTYEPETGTRDYWLPAGEYTFEFSGDGYYTAAASVTVAPERYQVIRKQVSPRLSFSDVNSGDWFYEYVFSAYSSGLMQGVSDTSFAPNGTVTRAMAATIIYRLAGEPEMPDSNWGYPYADVDAAGWYARAVYWARLNGIVNGTSESTFSPNTPVTREQLAAMLYRYAKYAELDTSAGSLDGFIDAVQISSWAREAASWAAGKGIITGTDSNRFDPRGNATRAQLAAMLTRIG